MRLVLALGGNAILRKNQSGTPSEYWANIGSSARLIAPAIRGYEAVITHGNGPQVGYLAEAFHCISPKAPMQPLDAAVAMTQGWLGYMITHALESAAREHGFPLKLTTIVTRVYVSRRDPEFSSPSKPVGPFYSREEAERLSREYGLVMAEDPRGGFRRLVPSPKPVDIIDVEPVEDALKMGYVAVAVGGGGIPIAVEDNKPVEAVVDKDLASSLLARRINADRLVILTDVPGVALNYDRPGERWLRKVDADTLEEYYRQGHFPPGSMGPKVEAAIEFVRATGGTAIIGGLDDAYNVIKGLAGTIVHP